MSFDGRLTGGQFATGSGGAAAARGMRRDKGLLFVVGKLKVQEHLIRGAGGRFLPEVQTRFAQANRVLAAQLQEAIAEKLEDTRVQTRKGVSSGRLLAAIKDPKNVVAAPGGIQFGFGVMDFKHLDSSQAKYWRTIEVGTSQFVGKEIRGVWGESLTGSYRTSPFNPSPGYPLAGGPFTTFGANRSGRLRPLQRKDPIRNEMRRAAYAAQRAAGRTSKQARMTGIGPVKGIIQNPIRPQRYAIQAWQEFDMARKVQQAYMNAFFGSIPSRAAIEFDYGLRDTPPRGRGSKYGGRI